METLANPEEAEKLKKMKKELDTSRDLTEVSDDFLMFEAATNRHFNREMNKM